MLAMSVFGESLFMKESGVGGGPSVYAAGKNARIESKEAKATVCGKWLR